MAHSIMRSLQFWNLEKLNSVTYDNFGYCIRHFQFYLYQDNLVLLHNHSSDANIPVLWFSFLHHMFWNIQNSVPIHPNEDDTVAPFHHISCVVLKLKISKNLPRQIIHKNNDQRANKSYDGYLFPCPLPLHRSKPLQWRWRVMWPMLHVTEHRLQSDQFDQAVFNLTMARSRVSSSRLSIWLSLVQIGLRQG